MSTYLKKTEKLHLERVEKAFKKLSDPETIRNLREFGKIASAITKTANVLETIKQSDAKVYTISKTDVCKTLGYKTIDCQIFEIPDLTKETLIIASDRMRKAKIAKAFSRSGRVWDNRTNRQQSNIQLASLVKTWDTVSIKIDNKRETIESIPIVWEFEREKFLVTICIDRNRETEQFASIFGKKDLVEKASEIFREIAEQYSPFKGKLIIVNNGDYEICSHKPLIPIEKLPIAQEILEEGNIIVNMFKNPDLYAERNIPFSRSVIFYGPPGTGKTTSISAIIQKILDNNGTVFMFNNDDLKYKLSSHMKLAEKYAPACVVIEDFDLIAQDRYTGNTVNSDMLQILSGITKTSGIVTLLSTNRIEDIDSAVTRAGRIDKGYLVSFPSEDNKLKIFNLHCSLRKVAITKAIRDISLGFLSDPYRTGAEIESMILSACQKSVCDNSPTIETHFKWAIETFGTINKKTPAPLAGF